MIQINESYHFRESGGKSRDNCETAQQSRLHNAAAVIAARPKNAPHHHIHRISCFSPDYFTHARRQNNRNRVQLLPPIHPPKKTKSGVLTSHIITFTFQLFARGWIIVIAPSTAMLLVWKVWGYKRIISRPAAVWVVTINPALSWCVNERP